MPLRSLAAVFAAGFLLRTGMAIYDLRSPIFPPHYYQDERDYAEMAAQVNDDIRSGTRLIFVTPGKELFTNFQAWLQRNFGRGSIAPRLASSAMAAASVSLWAWTAGSLAGPTALLTTGSFLALWPSHAFHTMLATKEAPIAFLLSALIALLAGAKVEHRRWAAAAALTLILAFLRSYLLPILVLAATATAFFAAAHAPRKRRMGIVAASLWLLAALTAFRPLKAMVLYDMHGVGHEQALDIIPQVMEKETSPPTKPSLSPKGLDEYRRALLAGVRRTSLNTTGRVPESLLSPDLAIDGWLDLAVFLPKACFYELFMPLPGLYPMDGKPGRMLAATEGVALLIAALAALWGLRYVQWDPGFLFLAAFFILAVPPTAFLEFDLGSASRHRIHYIPCLLPFAALAFKRRAG